MMRAVTFHAAVSVVACAFAFIAVLSENLASQGGSSRPLVSEAQYEAWQTELSNWGRWGRDDQLGTLNLITPAKRRAAPRWRSPRKACPCHFRPIPFLKRWRTSRARPRAL